MFKKLKRKFIIMNITIISIILFFSFTTIYLINYRALLDNNMEKLNRASSISIRPNDHPIFDEMEMKDLNSSFSIIKIGSDVHVLSYLSLDDDYYNQLLNSTLSSNKNIGNLELDDIEWMYLKTVTNNITKIAYIDVTDSNDSISTLLVTLIVIWFLMNIVVFYVSLYFSSKMLKPVEEAWIKQKRFIADASHELKTPLAIIGANIDVVSSNEKDSVKSQEKWIGYIKTEVLSMNKLITQLLNVASNNDSSISVSNVNVSSLINDIILSMETFLYEKNIKMENNISNNIVIETDLIKLRQLIVILTDNAIKYTNSNGCIKINLYKEKGYIYFNISNSGAKIEKTDLPYIFDRLYKCDKARTSDNSFGLGLSIARDIVDLFKWKINVVSNDEFTKFSLKIK